VIVVDASAVVEFLFATAAGDMVACRLVDPALDVCAPHLLDVEVANVIRRKTIGGYITAERGLRAVDDLGALNLERWSHELLLPRIWELRHNLTAYDAAYVALAEALGAQLLTCDRSIAGAPGIQCGVEVIG